MVNVGEKKRFNVKSARTFYLVAFILALCTVVYYGAVCVIGFLGEADAKGVADNAKFAGGIVLSLLVIASAVIGITRRYFSFVFGGLALILLPIMALFQSATKSAEMGLFGMQGGSDLGAILGILKYVFCGACVILLILALRSESLKSEE